jgi:NADH-quinone oxidoreductase subunit M
VQAPTAGSVILAGILLKMGTYGFVRFLLPIMPHATHVLMPWFLSLAVIGIVYGALVALVQKDAKKLVAYSSVSHLGMCMLGLFAMNPNGIMGGMFQMLNHGISTSGLFLIVGIVYERRHTRMVSDFGGLSKTMPVYATIFMIMTMSSIGLPGLNGFIGEFAILQGAFQAYPVAAVISTSGIILGAAYMLWLYQRVMFGPINDTNAKMQDLNAREIAYFVPLVAAAFWIGLYPKPVMDILSKPVAKLARQVDPAFMDAQDLQARQMEAARNGMSSMVASESEASVEQSEAHSGGH